MKKGTTYEQAVERLEEIVDLLHRKQPLEESLKLFQEGTEWIAFCQKKLDAAQLKVEQFTNKMEESSHGDGQTDA